MKLLLALVQSPGSNYFPCPVLHRMGTHRFVLSRHMVEVGM